MIWRQGSNSFSSHDSFPTEFERRIEPNTKTIVQRDECAVCRNGPCAAAERDHSRASFFQSVKQGERFDFAKVTFAILRNYFSRRAMLAFRDERIEIDHFAI